MYNPQTPPRMISSTTPPPNNGSTPNNLYSPYYSISADYPRPYPFITSPPPTPNPGPILHHYHIAQQPQHQQQPIPIPLHFSLNTEPQLAQQANSSGGSLYNISSTPITQTPNPVNSISTFSPVPFITTTITTPPATPTIMPLPNAPNNQTNSNGNNNNNNHNQNNHTSRKQTTPKKDYSHELAEVLDDLSTRFVINVPSEELASWDRIFFQIEAAHWFYEDFYRDQNQKLPSFLLREFARHLFNHCPLLRPYVQSLDEKFENFTQYKIRVPVFGAIILNLSMDKCLLVKGWTNKSNWGFPKGKVNKDEPETDCAIREVLEETGFDISGKIKEHDFIEISVGEQRMKLFIIPDIPEDTVFMPRTRKEISKISWIPINELPTSHHAKDNNNGISNENNNNNNGVMRIRKANNYYTVIPFVNRVKQWVRDRKRILKSQGQLREIKGIRSRSTSTPSSIANRHVTPPPHYHKDDFTTPKKQYYHSNSNPSSTKKSYTPYPPSPPDSPPKTTTNNIDNDNNNTPTHTNPITNHSNNNNGLDHSNHHNVNNHTNNSNNNNNNISNSDSGVDPSHSDISFIDPAIVGIKSSSSSTMLPNRGLPLFWPMHTITQPAYTNINSTDKLTTPPNQYNPLPLPTTHSLAQTQPVPSQHQHNHNSANNSTTLPQSATTPNLLDFKFDQAEIMKFFNPAPRPSG